MAIVLRLLLFQLPFQESEQFVSIPLAIAMANG
jgi:hypothetical protein